MQWQLGSYTFKNPLVLAPMAGVTDKVMRQICLSYGVSYVVGEMLSSQVHLWASNKSSNRLVDITEHEPRAVQLVGNDAGQLAEAAEILVEQGAQIIDLNLGCPAKKVYNKAAGSALMAEPEKVAEIFSALVDRLEVPVTVKMRTGVDDANKNAVYLAQLAEDKGLAAVTIHGRTRAAKFSGRAEYDTIKQVKSKIDIPVIANGDICHPRNVQDVLEYTGADAVMLGRAVLGRPWLFHEILTYLDKNAYPATSRELSESYKEKLATIQQHLAGIYDLYGLEQGVRIARKHLGWYAQYLPGGEELRRAFNQVQTNQEQLDLVATFFKSLTN